MTAYYSLFLVSFLAATILPAYSEVMFGGLLLAGYDPVLLWLWASTGNTLGAVVNWIIGRYLEQLRDRRWFPIGENALARAQIWFQRYGVWSLLFAWAPIGGDALTFLAGLMRVRFPVFLALTAAGKAARYAILIALVLELGPGADTP